MNKPINTILTFDSIIMNEHVFYTEFTYNGAIWNKEFQLFEFYFYLFVNNTFYRNLQICVNTLGKIQILISVHMSAKNLKIEHLPWYLLYSVTLASGSCPIVQGTFPLSLYPRLFLSNSYHPVCI